MKEKGLPCPSRWQMYKHKDEVGLTPVAGVWRQERAAQAFLYCESGLSLWLFADFPGGPVVKSPPADAGDRRQGFDRWVQEIPWRRKWQPIPGFLPGESHGQGTVYRASERQTELSTHAQHTIPDNREETTVGDKVRAEKQTFYFKNALMTLFLLFFETFHVMASNWRGEKNKTVKEIMEQTSI